MRRYPLFTAALLACSSSDAKVADSTKATAALASPRTDSATPASSGGSVAGDSVAVANVKPASAADLPIIRGLYVNRFAAQSAKRMRKLIDIADSTEVNAFVIDVKDEFGLNISAQDPMVQKNAGK